MGIIKDCQLHVKQIYMENEVKDLDIAWKFDKETGRLFIKTIKKKNHTMTKRFINMNTAVRDYGKYMH